MMRWNKGDAGFEIKDSEVAVTTADEDQLGPGVLFGHVINALATTLSRFGVTSVAVAVTMALLIATVLFTFFAGDAVALGQWCRKC